MRISVEQLSGETLVLEVTPEMKMREVKEQIKERHEWEDDLSRATTFVEVIFGERKLGNGETVAEVGLSADSIVFAIMRQNVARCSNKDGFGPDIDPETLVIVEIPDSEIEIGDFSFANRARVAYVTIPSSVRRIGTCAFHGCSALRHVTIPDSVTQIGRGAFADCSAMEDVTIPDSVRQIGDLAFARCRALRIVAIPESVTWIGKEAFGFCSQLTLRATARLLRPDVSEGVMLATECGCGECHYSWFQHGWVCPKHAGSSLQGCEKSVGVSFLSARRCKVEPN